MYTPTKSGHLLYVLVFSAAVLFLASASPTAAEEAMEWQPDPPMPKDFDWMQTTSLEWLKGELVSMYDGSVDFDSDEFDLQTVDWDDVRELRSAGVMQIGFEDGSVVVGQVLIDEETVRVLGDEERQFPRTGVLSITAGAPKEINYWSIKASVGADISRGNTEQTNVTSKADLIRRTPRSRISIDLLSTFVSTQGETSADNQRLSTNWNRFISKRFFWTPAHGELYRDLFQNIAQRYTVGMGLGYEIIDNGKITWDVTGGLAYRRTAFDDVAPEDDETVDSPSLALGTTYDHELSSRIDYYFSYDFSFVNKASGTYTHHLDTGFEFELTKYFDFDISFIWDRIRDPQPNADGVYPEQDDYRAVFFLGFDL